MTFKFHDQDIFDEKAKESAEKRFYNPIFCSKLQKLGQKHPTPVTGNKEKMSSFQKD